MIDHQVEHTTDPQRREGSHTSPSNDLNTCIPLDGVCVENANEEVARAGGRGADGLTS